MPKDIDVVCKCGSCGSCSCCGPTACGLMAGVPVGMVSAVGAEWYALSKLSPLIASKCGLFSAALGIGVGAGIVAGYTGYFAAYGIAKSCESAPESHSINDASNSLLAPAQPSQMQASYLQSVPVQPPPTYGSTGMGYSRSNKVD